MEFEKFSNDCKRGFGWLEGRSISELLKKKDEIVDLATKRRRLQDNRSWQEIMLDEGDPDDLECLICSL
jgi:hypothetical protein